MVSLRPRAGHPSSEARPVKEESLQQEVERLTGEHTELSRQIAEITGSDLPFLSSERPVLLSAVPDIIDVDALGDAPALQSEVRLPLAISDDLIRLIGAISIGGIEDCLPFRPKNWLKEPRKTRSEMTSPKRSLIGWRP